MSTALETTQRVPMMVEKIRFSDEQVGLIKATICPGYTDNELKLFLAFSASIGANPLAREVHTWKADGKVIFCRGIDWLRRNAMESSGRCYAPGRTSFTFKADGKTPDSATVSVRRWYPDARQWMETEATAWFDECNKGNSMWRARGRSQLAKCAEALALRQAFPEYVPAGVGISDGNELLVPPEAYPDAFDVEAVEVTEVPEPSPAPVPDAPKRGPGRPRKHVDSIPADAPPPVETTAEAMPAPPARPEVPFDGVQARRALLAQAQEMGIASLMGQLRDKAGLPQDPSKWTPDGVEALRELMVAEAAARAPKKEEF